MGVFLPWLHASLSLSSNDIILVGFISCTNVSIAYVVFFFFLRSSAFELPRLIHTDLSPFVFAARWGLSSAPARGRLPPAPVPPMPAVKAVHPLVPRARFSQGGALAGGECGHSFSFTRFFTRCLQFPSSPRARFPHLLTHT